MSAPFDLLVGNDIDIETSDFRLLPFVCDFGHWYHSGLGRLA